MPTPWWKNSRGELFVAAQFSLFALIAFAPRTSASLPEWNDFCKLVGTWSGGGLIICGVLLAAAGTFNLGRNLTPLITPGADAVLLDRGAYQLVRHPIYSGILQIALGYGLFVHGWLTLAYALALFILLVVKSRREEEMLRQRFPGYAEYSTRVRALIPFIF